jgi:hypothetical protein
MNDITIITDDTERARHQANVDRFLADKRNMPVFRAFCDSIFDEDITDDEIIDVLVLELGTDRINVIDRLAKIDFAAARAELEG